MGRQAGGKILNVCTSQPQDPSPEPQGPAVGWPLFDLPWLQCSFCGLKYPSQVSGAALSNKNLQQSDLPNVLYPCCPTWQPLASSGYWALRIWLVQLRTTKLNLIL